MGKGRHRARVASGPGGKPFVRTYSDPKTASFEGSLKLAASEAMRGRAPLEGPLRVAVFAFFAIPASWSKKKQQAAHDRVLRPTGKPDWDNVAKTADALNGIVWRDDAQIVDGFVRKYYSRRPALVFEVCLA